MSQSLGEIFGELGISQYLDAFVDQGFDTWGTILDITESDLDALGVKLGHRRKLQRRIANSRGVAPEAALVSPTVSPTQRSLEEQRQDASRADAPRADVAPNVVTKRKYRRHPKPDENAPERPPSAYVLFSNKMRDDLKDQHLTFTEIAKLVGENWQALSPSEKEPYESQAQAAKDKYNHDLAEYKRTPQYKEYLAYLQDFKAKHAAPAGEREGLKRVKLSEGSASPSHTVAPRRARSHTTPVGSGNVAASDGRKGSEPPPTNREHRIGSVASVPDYAASASCPADRSSLDRSPSRSCSPPSHHLHDASLHHQASSAPHSADGHGSYHQHTPQHHHTLPSLSNILENPDQPDDSVSGFHPFQASGRHAGPPGSPPGLVGSEPNPPPLKREYSSSASTSSGGSLGHPRTPIEGSMPIHLLLAPGNGKSAPGTLEASSAVGRPPSDRNPLKRSASPELRSSLLHYAPHHQHGHHQHRLSGDSPSSVTMLNAQGYFPAPTPSYHTSPGNDLSAKGPLLTGLPSFDGMTALLKAGEIVNRQAR